MMKNNMMKNNMKLKKLMVAMTAAVLLGSMSSAMAGSSSPLRGTKCWTLDPVLGKDVFVKLRFKRIGDGQSVFSGTAVRSDAGSADRVLMMSGSTSRHSFIGNDDIEISRHLLNLTYSFSKTGKDPAKAFAETGAALRGHYAVRLDPATLDGYFEGNDVIIDFPGGLTGPAATFSAQSGGNDAYAPLGLNNYLGGLLCDGTVPGFDNCGTVIPLNNAGTMTLVGNNKRQCNAADPFKD